MTRPRSEFFLMLEAETPAPCDRGPCIYRAKCADPQRPMSCLTFLEYASKGFVTSRAGEHLPSAEMHALIDSKMQTNSYRAIAKRIDDAATRKFWDEHRAKA